MDMTDSRHHRNLGKFIPGALVVLVGAVLLTSSLGFMDRSFWPNLGRLWPAAIVALGAYLALRRPFPEAARLAGAGILAVTVLAAVVLSATGTELAGSRTHFNGLGERVIGSGQMFTVERVLSPFHQIQIDGSTDVEVTIGTPPSAVLTIDDNLVDVIQTRVSGGTLQVWADQRISSSGGVLRVTVPRLAGIEIRGSGDAVVRGLDESRFKSKILGSGDIRLDGVVDVHDIVSMGSGDVEAAGLTTRHVGALIVGSGSVRVDVRIVGSGNLEYSGGRVRNQTIIGSGTLRRVPLGDAN